ncbi:phage tail protein [Erwinia sp. E_sp_W01_6]|uniref:phage tail protein n=1 Tax=unclassified Erwinia TaxID=2622719 RepID=UPI0030D4506F
MTVKYYALLTNLGAAKLANAAALGTRLQITQMAVGDGGGALPTPNASQTALINEQRRAPLNQLSIDAANSSQIIAEQIIPETDGGFWIREIGLFDADGVMIAVANCAETYKPQLQEGSGRTQTVRMIIIVSSTDAVTLKIDPSVVLATRKYVDDAVIEVKAYTDKVMAGHLAAADPHTQYAPKKSPVFTGIPKAPTAAAGDNSQQLANTAFVAAALAALTGSAPAALDTLNELAAALGNDPNFSATVLNALAGKMDIAKNGSDIQSVPAFLRSLGLGDAKYVTSRGSNVNGIWSIWSDGAIEMSGHNPTITSGLATVVFPISIPRIVRYISIAERLSTDAGASVQRMHTSMILDDTVTTTGFKARCQMASGEQSSNGFSWQLYCPPN